MKNFNLKEFIEGSDFFLELLSRSAPPIRSEPLSFLEKKAAYFAEHRTAKERKRWYYDHYVYYRYRMRQKHFINWLIRLKLPLYLSFLRWLLIDLIRGKNRRFKDIYQFVGLPGEGKTMSMVAHIERALEGNPDLVVATNFHYRRESFSIADWTDIISVALDAHKQDRPSLIAIDEIQNTFDASDWRSFPPALYTLLSFNRKLNMQFLCSAQIYERIPAKIRQLANYTVICKNVWKADRYFINYYFEKNNYESSFNGKRAKCEFIRDFVADDYLYNSYDSFEQVQSIKGKADEEKDKRRQALDLLFGEIPEAQADE